MQYIDIWNIIRVMIKTSIKQSNAHLTPPFKYRKHFQTFIPIELSYQSYHIEADYRIYASETYTSNCSDNGLSLVKCINLAAEGHRE